MEENDTRKWEDLDTDILVRILQGFDIFELTSGLGHICSTWRYAVCDPLLWRRLDLTMLKSNFIKIPLEPYVYVDAQSDKQLTKLLKISLSLSHGCITSLIFHLYQYVSDAQLTYTAERGIVKAINMWEDLESLTMPSIANPPYLMEAIAKNCKNFSQLKIFGPCDMFFMKTLIRCVPNLRVLSIRCSILQMDVLVLILEGLKNLEVLNISHCLIVEERKQPASRRAFEDTVLEKGSRLRKFYTCRDDDVSENES